MLQIINPIYSVRQVLFYAKCGVFVKNCGKLKLCHKFIIHYVEEHKGKTATGSFDAEGAEQCGKIYYHIASPLRRQESA